MALEPQLTLDELRIVRHLRSNDIKLEAMTDAGTELLDSLSHPAVNDRNLEEVYTNMFMLVAEISRLVAALELRLDASDNELLFAVIQQRSIDEDIGMSLNGDWKDEYHSLQLKGQLNELFGRLDRLVTKVEEGQTSFCGHQVKLSPSSPSFGMDDIAKGFSVALYFRSIEGGKFLFGGKNRDAVALWSVLPSELQKLVPKPEGDVSGLLDKIGEVTSDEEFLGQQKGTLRSLLNQAKLSRASNACSCHAPKE